MAMLHCPCGLFNETTPSRLVVAGFRIAHTSAPGSFGRLPAARRRAPSCDFVAAHFMLDYREAVLDGEYHGVMSELVGAKVDIIAAANIAAAVAAAKATSSIPIVMLAVNDPVGAGLVKSLERPGTNVTGTTRYAPQLIGERLRVLKRLVPNLNRISMILNGNNPNNGAQLNGFDRSRAGSASRFKPWIFASPRMSIPRSSRPSDSAPRLWSMRSMVSSQAAGHLHRCRMCVFRRADGARSRSHRRLP
jgi:hypothetical protein